MNALDCCYRPGLTADVSGTPLGDLIEHILRQHHTYCRQELPKLNRIALRYEAVLPRKSRLVADLRAVLAALTEELTQHMHKEERVLFPWIRQLETSADTGAAQCATIAAPIRVMEHEHDIANIAILRMRFLTNDFTPTDDRSPLYRTLLAGLTALETDLHQHIHEENEILFPRALALESAISSHA